MKILFVIDSLGPGGKERRMTELLKALKPDLTFDFELVIMSNEIHYKDILNLGIKIHPVIRKSRKDLLVFRSLYRICKNYKPDIVHCWESMTAIYCAPVCKVLNIRLVNGMVIDTPVKEILVIKTGLGQGLPSPSQVLWSEIHRLAWMLTMHRKTDQSAFITALTCRDFQL